MTVEQVGKRDMIGDDAVWCVWFEKVSGRQAAQRATFPPVALEKAHKTPSVVVGSISRA